MSDLAAWRARLAAVPDVALAEPDAVRRAIDDEVAYLASGDALDSLAADPYWPKWRSPWWSMVLLEELGEAARIPRRALDALIAAQDALLHVFPIRDDEWPPGADRRRAAPCHCSLGTIDRLLTACGVDVERALPWITGWYARYQMADGGYNCDETAYTVVDECPSSMVGTIAPLEAMLGHAPGAPCDRAAGLLIARELRHGSPTRHNEEERMAAADWPRLCFPRFYFYDTLRGASALVRWATVRGRALPRAAIAPVIDDLVARFPDGVIHLGRAAYAGRLTVARGADGTWGRVPAAVGGLLTAVSEPGAPSPALTRQWAATRHALIALFDRGLVTDDDAAVSGRSSG